MAALEETRAARGGKGKRLPNKKERKKAKAAQRRERLALREARLSGITERYTQELEALDELSARSQWRTPDSNDSSRPSQR